LKHRVAQSYSEYGIHHENNEKHEVIEKSFSPQAPRLRSGRTEVAEKDFEATDFDRGMGFTHAPWNRAI
jgi:hypothetical protein